MEQSLLQRASSGCGAHFPFVSSTSVVSRAMNLQEYSGATPSDFYDLANTFFHIKRLRCHHHNRCFFKDDPVIYFNFKGDRSKKGLKRGTDYWNMIQKGL